MSSPRDLINKLQTLLLEMDPRHSDHDVVTRALGALVRMENQIDAIARQFAIDYEGLVETEKPS